MCERVSWPPWSFRTDDRQQPDGRSAAAQEPLERIRDQARSDGMRLLMEDGLLKAKEGLTSLAEVERVCGAGG